MTSAHIIQFGGGPEILDAIELISGIEGYELKPLSVEVSKSKVRINLLDPKYQHHNIYLGLSLYFSTRVEVETFLFNAEDESFIRYGDKIAVNELKDIENLLEFGGSLLTALQSSHDIDFEAEVGARLLKDAGVTPKWISTIMEQIKEMNEHSAYGFITFVASMRKEDSKVDKIPYVAGKLIVVYKATRCGHCGHMLGV